MRFKNRTEAGKALAKKLLGYKKESSLVLALPRGGVPVAFEVAKVLEVPLDTLVVRKIGALFNPEFAAGAIAPGLRRADPRYAEGSSEARAGSGLAEAGNVLILDKNMDREGLGPVIKREKDEMERRILKYRSGEYAADSLAKTVIIIDDGLATGMTARAAIESALLQFKPLKVILAAPVCAKETAEALRDIVNVVCLREPEEFLAVGEWYEDFPQITDEEVVELLEKARISVKHRNVKGGL